MSRVLLFLEEWNLWQVKSYFHSLSDLLVSSPLVGQGSQFIAAVVGHGGRDWV